MEELASGLNRAAQAMKVRVLIFPSTVLEFIYNQVPVNITRGLYFTSYPPPAQLKK